MWVRTSVTVPGESTWAAPSHCLRRRHHRAKTSRGRPAGLGRTLPDRGRKRERPDLRMGPAEPGAVDVFRTGAATPGRLADAALATKVGRDLVHPEDLERDASRIRAPHPERRALRGRVPGRRPERKNLSTTPIAGKPSAIAPANRTNGSACVPTSPKRKLAEEAVSHLAAIVQCSEDAIVATDIWGTITTWNDGAQQLLGYTAAEAQTLSIATLFSSGELAREILSRIYDGQSSRLDEAFLLRRRRHRGAGAAQRFADSQRRRPTHRIGHHRPRHQRSQAGRTGNGAPRPA